MHALRITEIDRRLPVTCYERGSNVGGNWRYENDSGMSAAYASLRCNVSRRRMEYRSLPMPASYGDFPRHSDMAAYFEVYADTFGLRRHIEFRTIVEKVEPVAQRRWRVTLDDGRAAEYGVVVVANGHHWAPQWPRLAGASAAEMIHAQAYRRPEPFAGKRVLVIGGGQSAVEIATEVSRCAARTMLSVRRGAYAIPRYVFGRPFDLFDVDLTNRLPWGVLNWVFAALVRVGAEGRIASYGSRAPPTAFSSRCRSCQAGDRSTRRVAGASPGSISSVSSTRRAASCRSSRLRRHGSPTSSRAPFPCPIALP